MNGQSQATPMAACSPRSRSTSSKSPFVTRPKANLVIDTTLRRILSWVFGVMSRKMAVSLLLAAVALAAALFFGARGGPRLMKRDAPLFPGETLRGNQYISSCTSVFSFNCKPKFLELSSDGGLGIYGGRGPSDRRVKLWEAGTEVKGSSHDFELVYTGGKIVLNKDGKMKWSSPIGSLPKAMKPWPFSPGRA